jgi:hypothetical protein
MFHPLLRHTQICAIFGSTLQSVLNGQQWNRKLPRYILHHELMLRKLEFLHMLHKRLSVRAFYPMYLSEVSCDCLGLNCISARCTDYYTVRGEVLQKLLWQRSQTSWRHCCRHGGGGQRRENMQLGRVGWYWRRSLKTAVSLINLGHKKRLPLFMTDLSGIVCAEAVDIDDRLIYY